MQFMTGMTESAFGIWICCRAEGVAHHSFEAAMNSVSGCPSSKPTAAE